MTRIEDWPDALAQAQRDGLTQTQTAQRLRVTAACICQRCKRHGVSLKQAKRGRPLRDWPALLAAAQARGLSVLELAREQQVSRQAVRKAARRYGVTLDRPSRQARAA